MKPTNGIIHIYDGAYFKANCGYNCCAHDNNYGPSLVDLSQYALKPIRNSDSSGGSAYKRTSEFDKPQYNGILNYPNPFTSQTTINFSLKKTVM